jgi:glycosyltransferase involved in cell wall biosynthesis
MLSQVAAILDPLCASVLMITGNTDRIVCHSDKVRVVDIGVSMHLLHDVKPTIYSALLWFAKSVFVQLKESVELIRVRKDVDIVLFYVAHPYYFFPLLTAKILRKNAIEIVTRSKPVALITRLLSAQDPLLFRLLDGVSPESASLVKLLSIDRARVPVLPLGARFVDTSRYVQKKRINERKNVVGFISRLTREKGTADFVGAIPAIARENSDVAFFIGGSGELAKWVNAECEQIKTHGVDVSVSGWIDDDLPDRLNELKLLVLPTRTDAFPTILVEAMACGTPVLATSVGGIPDLIEEGETGFLLESGQTESIAQTVSKVLALPDAELERVATNALALVVARFSYSAAVERYRGVLARKAAMVVT